MRTGADFSARVRRRFGARASHYERHALLQQAVAWRLARHCRWLPLPAGPTADLGAGSGLLSRALLRHCPSLRRRPPLQLDLCSEWWEAPAPLPTGLPEGLATLRWDLNDGLPASLQGAALLASSFALQWLDEPAAQLARWSEALAPAGWLALAVPTAGSFPEWRRAAAAAGVPCTALDLPQAGALIAAVEQAGLALRRSDRLRFSRRRQGGLATLRHLQRLGADGSRREPLSAAQLRRLLRNWPEDSPLTWEVLVLVASQP
jgi:malonyl-CoA O-methyltransferase